MPFIEISQNSQRKDRRKILKHKAGTKPSKLDVAPGAWNADTQVTTDDTFVLGAIKLNCPLSFPVANLSIASAHSHNGNGHYIEVRYCGVTDKVL